MYTLKLTLKSLQNINNIKQTHIEKIIFLLKSQKFVIKGPIKKKKKNTIYTVLRSPHVNKKSREHFNFNFFENKYFILNNNIFELFNFLIILKKQLPKNILLKIQLKKN